jgi:hypothetical protein
VYVPRALLKWGGTRPSAASYERLTLKGSFFSSVMAFLLGKGLCFFGGGRKDTHNRRESATDVCAALLAAPAA